MNASKTLHFLLNPDIELDVRRQRFQEVLLQATNGKEERARQILLALAKTEDPLEFYAQDEYGALVPPEWFIKPF